MRLYNLLILKLFIASLAVSTQAEDYTNSIGMDFVKIKAGCFMMGRDSNSVTSGKDDEIPQHEVCIEKPFWMSKYEVTQAQWKKIMGNPPVFNYREFKGDNNPVALVSRDRAKQFLENLNKQDQTNSYRLPSEAEWEYVARAGTTTTYHWGDSNRKISDYAWHGYNSDGKVHPVGELKPNPWGLYDIHGNVWEWVEDCYHENYVGAPADGSAWLDNCQIGNNGESLHILRGGAMNLHSGYSKVYYRYKSISKYSNTSIGFRIVRITLD